MSHRRLLVTLGAVAAHGPELVARASPQIVLLARPVVVGDPAWGERGVRLINSSAKVHPITRPNEATPSESVIPCLSATTANLSDVRPGKVSAAAGQAAYDFLCAAIDLTTKGEADGIV